MLVSSKKRNFGVTQTDSFPFLFPNCLFIFFTPTDEREDVQKKTFTKWVNSQLAKVRELPASLTCTCTPYTQWEVISSVLNSIHLLQAYLGSLVGWALWIHHLFCIDILVSHVRFQQPCEWTRIVFFITGNIISSLIYDNIYIWIWIHIDMMIKKL